MKKFKSNKKGGISIETTVVSAIILTAGVVGIVYVNDKLDDSKKQLADNVEEKYEDKNLVVNIQQDNMNDDITSEDDPNILLGNSEDDKLQLVNLSFNLPLDELQDRTTTITLEGLKEIESLKVSNGGQLEIVSIDGDKVTIKVTGGDVKERVVVSGQYIAAQTKFVTKQENPNYTDVNGYAGTLTKYLDSYEPAYTKAITMSPTNLTNNFPATILYVENDLTTTLSKNGASVANVIKGSEAKTKTVVAQPSANYSETIDDYGVTTTYTGVLTQYVYSGEASVSKTSTTSQSNTTNSFPATMTYQDGNYSGTLSKSGSSTFVVTKGSPSASKSVTGKSTAYYSETITDNGKTATYTGTLTAYVNKGSASATKTVSKQVGHVINEFDDTIPYEETVTDNGKTTTYTGTLSKNGNAVASVIKGSASATKTVNAQTLPDYTETINDNGIETTYTGTLSTYVYQGSDVKTKTGTDTRTNIINEFDDTLPYSETINDNGIETKYTGTLSKSGNPTTTVRAGSNVASKNVTGKTSPTYYEAITDNGVSTAYTGTLTAYVNKGSEYKTKTVYDSRINTTGNFNTTIPYSENITDNGKTTTYSGTLSKSGNVTTTVRVGSNVASKYVTGQTGSSYSEYVNDNGVDTYYTGTLSSYIYKGSTLKTKTVTGTRTNTTGNFDSTIPYSEYVNDNGVTAYYTGNIPKSGGVSSTLTGGSAPDSKTVTDQPSSYYNTGGYSGTLTSYQKQTGSTTKTDSKTSTTNNFAATISYNSGGYSGTLSKTNLVTKGSALSNKTIGRTGSLVSGSSAMYGYYNWGAHCTGGNYNWKTESQGVSEYFSQQGLSYISGNLSSTTYSYAYGSNYSKYVSDNGVTAYYTGNPKLSKYNTGSHPLGALTICNGASITGTHSSGKPKSFRERVEVYWTGTLSKPNTLSYTQNYSGTVYSYTTRYQGTVYKPDTRTYSYTQNYSGTVTKPNTIVNRYQGTVSKPDTRQYNYTQNYSGTVSKPDTREYLYGGTVTKPDTRLYNYTQSYSGTVTKPNTIVTRYQGTVTKPDTREYGYTQTYTGTVTKPDTREYLYSGTVTKPDTREYLYTQVYTGTTYTPDTRVYKYQGTVTKPETRVYEYTQKYTGILNVPEKAIYMYQGEVIKPASDTRVLQSLYEYTVTAQYYR